MSEFWPALFALFGYSCFLGAVWLNLAGWRTHEERLRMIHDAAHLPPPNYWITVNAMKAVSFNKHLWLRLTFRDAMKHYPAEAKPEVEVKIVDASMLPSEGDQLN